MTFKDAVKDFMTINKPFGDYWSMQSAWACYTDALCKDGVITSRQWERWDNPCTPETFKRFNQKWYGLANC